jgi:hypothetical protein
MANLLYQNKKIYKIQELSKEIQENIELLEKQEKTKHYSTQPQNIVLTISDNDSIIIKKDTKETTLTTATSETTASTTASTIASTTTPTTASTTATTPTTKATTKNLNHEKPPAGRVGTKWDPTIIYWKNSLRGQYFFNNF